MSTIIFDQININLIKLKIIRGENRYESKSNIGRY